MSSREEELIRRVEAVIAATRRDAERVARDHAALEARRAPAARRGDLGRDWQEVQARIDAGRTTVADVFGGADESPAAVRLRERSRARLEAMTLPDELPDDLAAEVEALRAELP
ncbi:MAG TPA: hypothetical protein VFV89_08750 [Nocardioides sp.]|uniref:hypothetical protein n=1 Tax=Nocardioides sp. TaxID=35761 RepID=UPI002E3143FD|nr:hypothetical protein [Nocardioides sp.]HEX5087884.1 hypothetical protein [Nocardioides sp.]